METLVWAIKNGDLDQVKEKLEGQVSKQTRSSADLGPADKGGSRGIRLETSYRVTHCYRLQIAKINESVDGRNLIHYAADYGQGQVLEYLISQSANVNVSSSDSASRRLVCLH